MPSSKTERPPTASRWTSFDVILRGGPAQGASDPASGLAGVPPVAAPGPTGRRRPQGDAPDRGERGGRSASPPLHEALREPSAACFGPTAPPVTALSSSPSGAVAAADPAALVAAAEQVLRSLRVGTDGRGRSLVQLDVAVGALAGCRIELRRVGDEVEVHVRDDTGATDPREQEVVDALRRRGIEVVVGS